MPNREYSSSGSSRASTPSSRNSKSYLEPLSIHKEPKQQQQTSNYSSHYPDPYLNHPHSTLPTPRRESTHSRSSANKSTHPPSSRKSTLKPLSIHQPTKDAHTPRDDIQSDKRHDSRYYTNSFFDDDGGRDAKKHSSASSRKNADSRYYPNSSF